MKKLLIMVILSILITSCMSRQEGHDLILNRGYTPIHQKILANGQHVIIGKKGGSIKIFYLNSLEDIGDIFDLSGLLSDSPVGGQCR